MTSKAESIPKSTELKKTFSVLKKSKVLLYNMDFPEELTRYSIEGAAAFLIMMCAYKIYKLRITTESDCCKHAFRIRTVSRGDSHTDLELPRTRPRTQSIVADEEEDLVV